jgi:BirA family transcriptional regulator, biotin operon repressor / biotin---[acetyl-CoA-carboxylase] ligase
LLRDDPLAAWIRQIHFAESAGSTNQLARQAVENGAPSGSLFVASCQSAGRGRRGRTWLSDHPQGLWFSLLLRPDQSPARLSALTLFAGYCVAAALRQEMGAEVGIKWPNDVVSTVNNRKLCGILTEMIVEEQTAVAVIIGIGLNVNTRQFPAELTGTATSLYLECGREFRRVDVLAAVLRQFAGQYESFISGTSWLDRYQQLCLTLGREILVLPGSGESYAGRAVGLDATGELIVEDNTGRRQTILSGEVSIRGLPGDAKM